MTFFSFLPIEPSQNCGVILNILSLFFPLISALNASKNVVALFEALLIILCLSDDKGE